MRLTSALKELLSLGAVLKKFVGKLSKIYRLEFITAL